MIDDPGVLWWLKALGYSLFAAIGGFMGHLLRTIDSGKTISWSRAVLEGASAAFVGFMMMLLCQAMKLGPEWTGVIVGVAGWLGASVSIRVLETFVRRKLGLEKKDES